MQVKKQQLELDMGQQTVSKSGKKYACLFNLHEEYIMRNAGLEEAQERLPAEISITSDLQMTPPLWKKVKKNKKAS